LLGFARLIRPRYALANLGHPSSSYWAIDTNRMYIRHYPRRREDI
jgi:hypothetical protein